MSNMRKHKEWCTENDAAHAWEGQDNVLASPADEITSWLAVRICENCGKKQTRKIVSHEVLTWEEVP